MQDERFVKISESLIGFLLSCKHLGTSYDVYNQWIQKENMHVHSKELTEWCFALIKQFKLGQVNIENAKYTLNAYQFQNGLRPGGNNGNTK